MGEDKSTHTWSGDKWRTPGAFVAYSADDKPPEGEPALLLFCEEAYLVDRGVVVSLGDELAETLIIDVLTKDAAFCKEMEISDEQAARIRQRDRDDLRDVPFPFTLKSRLAEEALTFEEQQDWTERAHLISTLTAKQKERLPAIFLQLEGLMALRRIEFRELIGLTFEEQKKLVSLHDEYGEIASEFGRALFTLRNDDFYLEPSIILELRMISVALEHEILNTLSAEQQRRLVPIVERAQKLRSIVRHKGWLAGY